MIGEFFRHTFTLTSPAEPSDVVEEAVEGDAPISSASGSADGRTRAGMVVAINWVMLLILIVGFGDIVASSWLRPGIGAPDIVQDVVSGATGYFLSSIAAFV